MYMKTVPLIYVLAPLPKVLRNCAEAWGLSLNPSRCYCALMRSVGPVSKPHCCYCGLMRSVGPVPTAPLLLLLGHHADDASYYDVGIRTASNMSWKLRFSWSWNATDVWLGK